MRKHPLSDYSLSSCAVKFITAVFFGLFVDAVIFVVVFYFSFRRYGPNEFPGWLAEVMIAVPLIWGVLGIFCFHRMIDLSRRIFEGIGGYNR